MPRRRARSPRRSATEWAVSGALAIAAAGLGTVSVLHSLAYMIRGSAPARAHALAPWDGRITALLSEQLSGPTASLVDRKRADDLARLALFQDPTAVPAVATLGINAQVQGETAAAREMFSYSQRLSRRDLRTRLWAIEDAVGRNDIPEALRNYDIALRTSRVAPDLLFPVLASAINEADIRGALITTLAKRPPWGQLFVAYVAENGPDARATAAFMVGLQKSGIPQPDGSVAALIARLLAEGHSDDAWRYYAAITPGVDRRRSRDPNFTTNRTTPFDWNPLGDSGISTTMQRGDRGNIFDFTVPSNLGGPLLRQTQMLPPGKYRIEGRSTGIEQPDSALPYWLLSCADGRELGRVTIPASTRMNGRFMGEFNVPAGCTTQQLALVAKPSDQMSGVTGQIESVQLTSAP